MELHGVSRGFDGAGRVDFTEEGTEFGGFGKARESRLVAKVAFQPESDGSWNDDARSAPWVDEFGASGSGGGVDPLSFGERSIGVSGGASRPRGGRSW